MPTDSASPPLLGDVVVDPGIDSLLPTFRFMVHRKLRRKAHGQYRRNSTRRYIFSTIVIALFLTLVGIGAQQLELAASWPELALVALLLIAMIYIVVKVSIVIRWCFYWLVLATLVLFAINKGSLFDQIKGEQPGSDSRLDRGAKIVLICLALLEVCTLGVVFLNRVSYPRIVLRAKWLSCKRWWRIREAPRPSSIPGNYRSVVFSYLSWDPDEYRLSRTTVSYVGEFDNQGRPHGLGEWTDHSFTGEALQGIWDHGLPVGPFKSQEYGTGNAFSNIRIGYCKNSLDKNDSTKFNTARDPKGISYGAASVECSVSGKFFHHLPHVRVLGDPTLRSELMQQQDEEQDWSAVALSYPLSYLSTFAESLQSRPSLRGSFHGLKPRNAPLSKSIVVRYTDRGIFIPGYIRSRRKTNVNEVVLRRVCPPTHGVEGQNIVANGVTPDPSTDGPPSTTTSTPRVTLQLPRKDGPSSNSSGSDGDSDGNIVDRLAVQDGESPSSSSSSAKMKQPRTKDRKRNLSQVGLVVDGWRQVLDVDGRDSASALTASRAGYEALVFVHGYNCALTYGIGRLGQLLSLGEFPPYIKPFVFSWPSSTTFGYFNAKTVGCSDDVAKDLRQFVDDLKEAGFRRVHFLVHSMGARIVLSAIRKGIFEGAFQERETVDAAPSMVSSTVGSEAHLHGRKSIRYRDAVSGLGHHHPESRRSSTSSDSVDQPPTIQLATFTLLNPDADYEEFMQQDYWILSKYCPHITIYADAHDGALFWSEVLGRKESLGRHPRTLVDEETGEILDVDVIDTTSLDVNIHSIRHNFFNLNRMLVDDLYDVVVLGHRAREREGRLSSRWTFSAEGVENGEVYTFLCAPSYVVNK